MNLLFLFAVLLGGVSALPTRLQRQSHAYQFEYATSDGSKRQEVGTFVFRDDASEPILHVEGMYSYLGRDGREYVVSYEADDNGVKTKGDFVPPFQSINRKYP